MTMKALRRPAVRFWRLAGVALLVVAAAVAWRFPEAAERQEERSPARREFSVSARKYAFSPARLEVRHNDLVKIQLTADDIAHSFTIDAYRIAKRAAPGQTVVFEFRADQPGTFPFYCNLTVDDGCREMRGELVVR